MRHIRMTKHENDELNNTHTSSFSLFCSKINSVERSEPKRKMLKRFTCKQRRRRQRRTNAHHHRWAQYVAISVCVSVTEEMLVSFNGLQWAFHRLPHLTYNNPNPLRAYVFLFFINSIPVSASLCHFLLVLHHSDSYCTSNCDVCKWIRRAAARKHKIDCLRRAEAHQNENNKRFECSIVEYSFAALNLILYISLWCD